MTTTTNIPIDHDRQARDIAECLCRALSTTSELHNLVGASMTIFFIDGSSTDIDFIPRDPVRQRDSKEETTH